MTTTEDFPKDPREDLYFTIGNMPIYMQLRFVQQMLFDRAERSNGQDYDSERLSALLDNIIVTIDMYPNVARLPTEDLLPPVPPPQPG